MAIAHLRADPDGTQSRHSLEDHLRSTAALAKAFAALFSSQAWAELAGLWHDLGKYRPGFQRYIEQAADIDAHIEHKIAGREKTHSAAGAVWAERRLVEACGAQGKVLARVMILQASELAPSPPDWSTSRHAMIPAGASPS